MAPAAGVTVEQLYDLWAADSELRDQLRRSFEPRGTDWLFELFAEDGNWDVSETLLGLSLLDRREDELRGRFGEASVTAYAGGQLWGVHQLIGKLCPTVYVRERRG